MKQLSLFGDNEWGIQPGERSAATPELNSAREEVTAHVKPEGGRHQDATQVKVLSLEITNVTEADAVHLAEGRMDNTDKGEVVSAPSGSKAVARCQKDGAGTGETQGVPRDEVCNNKPIDGKELQKASWESDQSIVVMKLRNGSGAKGLAGKSMGRGHIFRTQRRIKGGNKTLSTTYIGREVFLKSRMREICTSGSVRGLIVAPDDNNL